MYRWYITLMIINMYKYIDLDCLSKIVINFIIDNFDCKES
jgi:hypothetical protein